MPQYLDGGPANAYAINNLGQTFSNAVLGMQARREHMQQIAAQQAMDAAYLRMAQEKQQAQMPMFQAQAQSYQADAMKQRAMAEQARSSQQAGQDLGFNLKQFYDAQQNKEMHPEVIAAIQAQIAANQGQLAATHPANIAEQVPQIMESYNPQVRQMIATGQKPFQPIGAGGLYDVQQGRPAYIPPHAMPKPQPDEEKKFNNQLALELLKVGSANIRNLPASKQGPAFNELLQRSMAIHKGESSGGGDQYDSEADARAKGKGPGDKVRLKGIGLVQLH